MIEVTRNSGYKECLNCHSTENVLLISIGNGYRMNSIKLCANCIKELINKLEESKND